MESDEDLQSSRSSEDDDEHLDVDEGELADLHIVIGGYDEFDEVKPMQISAARKAQTLPFTVLAEEDIKQRQEAAIESVMSVLFLSKTQAGILLRNYEWCPNRVHEKWFADELNVRDRVGLLEKPTNPIKPEKLIAARLVKEMKCSICLEYHPKEIMQATACCDHFFCLSCWGGYVHTSLSELGMGCLSLRCPISGCNAAVGDDLIFSVVSQEDKTKYMRYILRSFVEGKNRTVKWCPAPRCENAIELRTSQCASGVYVACACGHKFCWNCSEEVHRPVECSMAAKWLLKASAHRESQSAAWIVANTKPCPMCKRPIQKSSGCMHMTCTRPCSFEFCWLCLGPWSEHFGADGYVDDDTCSRYDAQKEDPEHREDERRRRTARKTLQTSRYTHYYDRWASNETRRTMALSHLRDRHPLQLQKLLQSYCLPISQLEFIGDAWLQIAECRCVLKWTYAYGYYLPEEEDDTMKKQIFEYLQGQAEAALERLHDCAENDVQACLGAPATATSSSFNDFRAKLDALTTLTRKCFENLLRALEENGLRLQDVIISHDGESSAPPPPEAASSKAKKRPARRLLTT